MVARASGSYVPAPIPNNPDLLSRWLQEEFFKIQSALAISEIGFLPETFIAPAKPRTGDIRLADGTHWNPGSGAGVYCYYASAWHFLG